MSFLRRLRQTSLTVNTNEQSSMMKGGNSDNGLDLSSSSASAGGNKPGLERAVSPLANDEGDFMDSDGSSSSSFDDLKSVEVPSSPIPHAPSSRGEDVTVVDPSTGSEVVKNVDVEPAKEVPNIQHRVAKTAEVPAVKDQSSVASMGDDEPRADVQRRSSMVALAGPPDSSEAKLGIADSTTRADEGTKSKPPPQTGEILSKAADVAVAAPLPAAPPPEPALQAFEHYDTPLQGPLAPLKKREITILLVGETGTGKTTFMSLLANVCANRTVKEFVPEHNLANDSKLDASQSQTKAAMVYEMVRCDGVLLRVLDTPGLCDTRGIDQDRLHKASIANAIRDHVSRLDAIIIMANGTNERLTVPTDYALNTLSAMFPASIAKNIGFLFTMVDNLLAWNFQSTSLPPCLRDADLWAIQNPLALVVKYRERLARGGVAAKQERVFDKLLHDSYDTALDTLNLMFAWLDERVACPTAEISNLYSKTIGIEAAITDVIVRLHQMEARRHDLTRLRAQLEKSRQTMKINEQYEKIMQRQMHVQEDTPSRHTTQCTVADCYSNCHMSCRLDFLLDPAEIGRECTAFHRARQSLSVSSRWMSSILRDSKLDLSKDQNALALKCDTCGHEARDHRHFHSNWILETKEERIVDEEAKRSYEGAEQKVHEYQAQLQRIENSLETLDTDILSHQKRLSTLCEEFQMVALSGNFAGHLASTIRMLEYRRASKEASGDVEGARELSKLIVSFEEKIRVLRDTEEKKHRLWSLTRVANAMARWVPKGW